MSGGRSFFEIDIQFARFLARVSGDGSPELFAAAALTSNARGRGNICLDLSSEIIMPDDANWTGPVDAAALRAALAKSPAVGRPGDYRPLILDGPRLYLYRYWEYEDTLAQDLKTRAAAPLRCDSASTRERLKRLFPQGSPGQKRAAVIAAIKPFTVITGGPGTGKTSAVARTIALLNELAGSDGNAEGRPLRTALAAPTGKAAARLEESIRSEIESIDCGAGIKAAIPIEASTLHRLLRWGPRGFRHNRANRLNLDLVVVDEASMVDLALLSRLVQALPARCRLILLGDRDQLASVEAGAVLGDICGTVRGACSPEMAKCLKEVLGDEIISAPGSAAMADCIAWLEESFRFGPASPIGNLSRAVNAGDSEMALGACAAAGEAQWRNLPDRRRLAAELKGPVIECFGPVLKSAGPGEALRRLNDFRILSALREGPYGVRALNEIVKEILRAAGLISPSLSEGGRYYKGCPIMVTSNNYSLDLYNGDVGIVWPDPDDRRQLRAFFAPGSAAEGTRSFPLFSLPEHETVYAMTVHKSQGSEFGRVVFILPDRDAPLLTRELVYTAVTRARGQVEIWGKRDVFSAALGRRIERSSGLREALWKK
jgi:exodeoxyribonuclease V alpha subunit